MQRQIKLALIGSCLLHAIVFLLFISSPKGSGTVYKPPAQLHPMLAYIIGQTPTPRSIADSKVATLIPASSRNAPAPTIPRATSPAPADSPFVEAIPVVSQTKQTTAENAISLQDAYGIEGQANITYWPVEQVDQPAIMLAEWPEDMSASAWPPGQPVNLELWINPDGALADIAFSQKDLPDSLRITLIEIISRSGFKPALKDGYQVGNHRVLEVLLSQISVPPLANY